MKDSPIDLLKQIEVLITEIFSILILYPKTFATVLLQPRKLTSITDKEIEKPINERFDAYSSPMVYWLLTLLPFAYYSYSLSRRMGGIGKIFIGLFFTVTVDIYFPTGPNQVLPKVQVPPYWDFFLEIAIPYAMVPFAFSVAVQIARRSHFSKTSMTPVYYEQFYLFGTLSVLLVLLLAALLFLPRVEALKPFSPVAVGSVVWAVSAIAWYVYAQVRVIQTRTGLSGYTAVIIIAGGVALAVLLTWSTNAVFSEVIRLH